MAGELTYRRLLNWLKILEADESDMLDRKVQVKLDDTDVVRHIECIMVTSGLVHAAEPANQPYLLTCADPQELDDDEEWDGPGDCTIDWEARAEYERRGDLDLNPDWRGRPPYIRGS